MARSGRITAVGPARPGAMILQPAQNRMMGPLFLTIFGAIWNGVVWFIALRPGSPFRNPGSEVFSTLFLGFFALAGLAIALGAIHQWLALVNPEPTLVLSKGEVAPGDAVQLDWSWTGQVSKLRGLTVTLEGCEHATYKRGTSTSTDRHVFHRSHPILTKDPATIAGGTVSVEVPPDTMHSWESPNNRIVWTLTLRGDIPRWPDVSVEYPLLVKPKARS